MSFAVHKRSPIHRLISTVRAVVDPAMHPGLMRTFLENQDPEMVVRGLRELVVLFERPGHRQAYHALVRVILDERGISYHRKEELYRAAVALDSGPLRHLLLTTPARLVATQEEVLPDPQMLEISLGVRKSMAKLPDRDKLTRLAMDPSVPVVEILLHNPKVIEQDVVRIAARRPNMVAVLELVARHPKWSSRYDVQLALAQNPYSPTRLAAAMTPFLKPIHLFHLAQDAALHDSVRDVGHTIISWRKEAQTCTT
ncbi:MAG TPA: hypothetical protein EYN06_00600 [Myxococcales bacterium]|nr:hypothetical protein [Myxococcales bacterium]HIN84947.1 hypothetical protein [Myxococcales bacterium]